MARKKSARRNAEPENLDAQAALEATEPTENGGSITKTEAVRRALAAGKELPGEAVPYIQSEFGIEINPQHFSAVKSGLKKRGGATKPKGRPGRKPREAEEGYLAPPARKAAQGEDDLLAAIEAMKPLVESLGADRVKRIADLLG
jgi:hypothetical protein